MPSKNWNYQEAICRGEDCPACAAAWKDDGPGLNSRTMIHKKGCTYWAWMQKERVQR